MLASICMKEYMFKIFTFCMHHFIKLSLIQQKKQNIILIVIEFWWWNLNRISIVKTFEFGNKWLKRRAYVSGKSSHFSYTVGILFRSTGTAVTNTGFSPKILDSVLEYTKNVLGWQSMLHRSCRAVPVFTTSINLIIAVFPISDLPKSAKFKGCTVTIIWEHSAQALV